MAIYGLEQQSRYKDKNYAIPGLFLNRYAENPRKIVQIILSKDLKDETENIVWHNVLNIINCRHKSNIYQCLSVPDLENILKTLQGKLNALVYVQSDRTPDTFDSLKESEKSSFFQVFSIVKDFLSVGKQNNTDLWKQLKTLHQSPENELKNIDFILRKKRSFLITAKSLPKRPSKRARNARKKNTTTCSFS